jgi:c-di-GMP-binding flagellar brake protein YcgR
MASPALPGKLPRKLKAANDNSPKLKIGDVLQLQFVDHPERGRFSVKVIGNLEGYSLIITAPANNGSLLMLKEGQQFIVRSLSGRQIMAFQAEVLKAYMVPYPHVHLRIQRAAEKLDVRNAHRVNVDLIAAVRPLVDGNEQASSSASIVDISTTGCLMRMHTPLDESVTAISLSLRFDVAEHNRTLHLPAQVCSHREVSDENAGVAHLYGVKFEDIEDDKRLMLYCYVYEQITHEVYND